MAHLPEEREMETDPSIDLSPSWPTKGDINFNDVSLRYRAGLSLALKGLTFSVMPGERCGIVGRTGSGCVHIEIGVC
jgi:ABC-type multidrug transport system fused ATPase/permease subunit